VVLRKRILNEKFNAHNSIAQSKGRQFGLGTYLPWDTLWVIDSSSDSTIYMAYYTPISKITNVLQGENNLIGDSSLSPVKIDPTNLADGVLNFIFHKGYSVPENNKMNFAVFDSSCVSSVLLFNSLKLFLS
jgi:leucyl-tRNA synthetase